jgi:hypothetical protein
MPVGGHSSEELRLGFDSWWHDHPTAGTFMYCLISHLKLLKE